MVAIDVGGTTVKAAYVDTTGTFGAPVRPATPVRSATTADEVIDLVVRTADALAPSPDVPLGLAVPGIVDEERGVAVFSENLGWRDVDFVRRIGERTRRPVHLSHDVRASGLAEVTIGAGRGASDVVVVTIGTGIAAAVIVNGLPVVREGFAGELGHVVVDVNGTPCLCGNRGCLETVASAHAIGRRYSEQSGSAVAGAKEVLARAGDGDRVAMRVWDRAIDGLAEVLASVSAVLAPERIVIAGGLSEAGEALIRPLSERIAARYVVRPVDVRRAELGQDAGLVGVALAARTRVMSPA